MTNYGWVCPRCSDVNAPWVEKCGCNPDGVYMTGMDDFEWEYPYGTITVTSGGELEEDCGCDDGDHCGNCECCLPPSGSTS